MQAMESFDIKKYLKLLLKYKWYAVVPACILMVVLAIASSLLPRVYESTCVVEIEQGSIENPLSSGRDRTPSLNEHLFAFSENAFKWDILSVVIDTVGADRILQNSDQLGIGKLKRWLKGSDKRNDGTSGEAVQQEKVAGILRSDIEIRPRPPRFLRLSYRGTIPEANSDILNSLVTVLIEETKKAEVTSDERSYEFLKRELESYKQQLEASETELREFREKHVTELPNNISMHLSRLTADQSEMMSCELELQELTAREDYIDQQLQRQNELIVSEVRREANPMLMVLSERIVDMEIELTRLRTNYTDLHPSVVELKGQLEDLKKQQAKLEDSTVNTETSMLNPMHQQLMQDKQETQLRLEVLKNRMKNLSGRIAENEEKVRSVPAQEQELIRLTRNYEVNENIYNMFLEKLEEAKIQSKLATEEKGKQSFEVLQYARPTSTPIAPDKTRILMAIVAAGFALAFGIGYLFYFLDDSLESVEEAKSLINKPLLGTIPLLDEGNGNGMPIIGKTLRRTTKQSHN